MENAEPLKAQLREGTGKGFARRLRAEGMLPGVCYGAGGEATSVTVDPKELLARLTGDYGRNAIFRLEIEGREDAPVVRVNEYQRHPVKRTMVHVDFEVLTPTKQISTSVPLILEGKPRGVANGGVLRQARHALNIVACPADMPTSIKVDVSDLRIGAVRRVKEITAPEGVEVRYDSNFTVAGVFLPRGIKATDDEEEEG